MLQVTQSFINKLESKDLRYDYYEGTAERNERIRVGFNGEHGNEIAFYFFFDPNGTTVNIKVFSICKVSAEKLMDLYVLLNQLNCEYRWVKFYLNDDNEVTCSGDAVLQPESAGEELYELLSRFLGIIDDLYPRIMKAVWA